ncbi:MAG: hypothetical protein COA79_02410 [Planctomycetota bacterium]|nr:MAG: hypothetical protein COA79_02410 [Planctomycetota bacterium]
MKVNNFNSREELQNEVISLIKTELQRTEDCKHAIMLSGGSTPLVIYNLIAEHPFDIDKNAIITYSDERYVAIDSPENNYFNTLPMLQALKMGPGNVINVKTKNGLEEAANAFHNDLKELLNEGSIPLGFLGMGTDGHTASLFSLKNVAEGEGRWSIPVEKESPPHRISVSKDLLNKVGRLIFILTGEEKKEKLDVLLNNPEAIPAGLATIDHPNCEVFYCA